MRAIQNRVQKYKANFGVFRRDLRGNVAITAAIAAVPMVLAVGIAVDYSSLSQQQTDIQVAMDAAVLAGVAHSGDNDDKIKVAREFFEVNTPDGLDTSDLTFQTPSDRLVGQMTVSVERSLTSVVSSTMMSAVVTSTAELASGGTGIRCIFPLDPSASEALILNVRRNGNHTYSGTSITATDCVAQVNSMASDAVYLKTGEFTSSENCFVGDVDGNLSDIFPAPNASCTPLDDPLASYSIASPAGCNHPNEFSFNGSSVALNPGKYCGGIDVKADTITFNSGVYYIKGGVLKIESDDTVTGENIAFVMEAAAQEFEIEANNIRLVGRSSGPASGFIFFDRSTGGHENLIKVPKDGGTIHLEGVVHSPNNHFELFWKRPPNYDSKGNSNPPKFPHAAFVTNTIDFHGYAQRQCQRKLT